MICTTAMLMAIFATPAHGTPVDTGRWRFAAWSTQDSIIAEGLATTWWDRTTASGISASQPGRVGISLPTGRCRLTRGTPFPRTAWRTEVRVYSIVTGKAIMAPLIDEGPSWRAMAGTGRRGSAMADLTRQAWRNLGHRPGTHKVRITVPRCTSMSGTLMPQTATTAAD